MGSRPRVRVDHFSWIPVFASDAKCAGIPPQEWRELDLESFRMARKHGVAGPVVQVLRGDVWVEQSLEDEWIAAYRLVPQDGLPVVAELRIFPMEKDRSGPGEWSGTLRGIEAPVPAGGLTSRIAHSVRTGIVTDVLRQLKEKVREMAKTQALGPEFIALEFFRKPVAKPKRAIRLGRPDIFYARLAREYMKLLRAGTKDVNQQLAQQQNVSPEKIRDMIHQARKRGLLGPAAKQGKPGGDLTPKCRALLSSMEKKSQVKRRS